MKLLQLTCTNTYYVSGNVLCMLQVSTHLISQEPDDMCAMVIPISQMWKLKTRNLMYLVQVHTDNNSGGKT